MYTPEEEVRLRRRILDLVSRCNPEDRLILFEIVEYIGWLRGHVDRLETIKGPDQGVTQEILSLVDRLAGSLEQSFSEGYGGRPGGPMPVDPPAGRPTPFGLKFQYGQGLGVPGDVIGKGGEVFQGFTRPPDPTEEWEPGDFSPASEATIIVQKLLDHQREIEDLEIRKHPWAGVTRFTLFAGGLPMGSRSTEEAAQDLLDTVQKLWADIHDDTEDTKDEEE